MYGLEMGYDLPPEVAYGKTWHMSERYSLGYIRDSFDDLPARFENQYLRGHLRKIEAIEAEQKLEIVLEPMRNAEPGDAGQG